MSCTEDSSLKNNGKNPVVEQLVLEGKSCEA